MSDFKSIKPEVKISDEYGTTGAKPVFVESVVDRHLYQRKWFTQLGGRLYFIDATDGKSPGGGGCRVVLQKMKIRHENGLSAVGIVDRDALLSKKNLRDTLFWEIDDDKFSEAKPFGEFVFVLHRWELENYLFHPDIIYEMIWDKEFVRPTLSSQEIAERLCGEETDFMAATAFSTLHAAYRSDGDRQAKDKDSWELVGDDLKKQVLKRTNCNEEQFLDHERKMQAFAENEQDSIKRWEKICRILDGKRTSCRIGRMLRDKTDFIESNRSFLADKIANLPEKEKEHWVRLKNWLYQVAGT